MRRLKQIPNCAQPKRFSVIFASLLRSWLRTVVLSPLIQSTWSLFQVFHSPIAFIMFTNSSKLIWPSPFSSTYFII